MWVRGGGLWPLIFYQKTACAQAAHLFLPRKSQTAQICTPEHSGKIGHHNPPDFGKKINKASNELSRKSLSLRKLWRKYEPKTPAHCEPLAERLWFFILTDFVPIQTHMSSVCDFSICLSIYLYIYIYIYICQLSSYLIGVSNRIGLQWAPRIPSRSCANPQNFEMLSKDVQTCPNIMKQYKAV